MGGGGGGLLPYPLIFERGRLFLTFDEKGGGGGGCQRGLLCVPGVFFTRSHIHCPFSQT